MYVEHMKQDISFIFDADKNALLKETRGVTFEDVIYCIQNNQVLDILPHPNTNKYPEQYIFVVEIGGYAYQVPFRYEASTVRLITVFPSRKSTKKYKEKKE